MEADDITVMNLHEAIYVKNEAEVVRLCREAEAQLDAGESPYFVMERLASRLEIRGRHAASLASDIRKEWRLP